MNAHCPIHGDVNYACCSNLAAMNPNEPQSLQDAAEMLRVLLILEGDKLLNRDKLQGIADYLRRLTPPEEQR